MFYLNVQYDVYYVTLRLIQISVNELFEQNIDESKNINLKIKKENCIIVTIHAITGSLSCGHSTTLNVIIIDYKVSSRKAKLLVQANYLGGGGSLHNTLMYCNCLNYFLF